MSSSLDLYALSDDSLLAKEERARKVKYELVAMITSHFLWCIFRLLFDLIRTGVLHPHLVIIVVVGLCHYTAKLCKAEYYLLTLRQKIGTRARLIRRRLTLYDYVEAAATGIGTALGRCAAVEVLNHALGV